MKTKLFLIATLLISTITFSQTSKKGYDYYQSIGSSKMNKAELIDAMAKDNHLRKRPGRTKATDYNSSRSNKSENSYKTQGNNNFGNNSNNRVGYRSQGANQKVSIDKFNVKQEFGPTQTSHDHKRPGRIKTSNRNSQSNHLRKRPGRTKATDYNSSRSNRRS